MIINTETIEKAFKAYDKEIVVEIIDLFFEEYPERIAALEKAFDEKDSELLRTTAHGLKGVVSHFYAEGPRTLSKDLEEKGTNGDFDKVGEMVTTLGSQLKQMAEELQELKENYR